MSKTKQIDSPPLTEAEIADVEYFRAHPEEHKVMTPEEFFKEIHDGD